MGYEVLFYDGWVQPPTYYLGGTVEGDSPDQPLIPHLGCVTQEIQDSFSYDEGWSSDAELRETVYVVCENGLISVQEIERAGKASAPRSSARRKGKDIMDQLAYDLSA